MKTCAFQSVAASHHAFLIILLSLVFRDANGVRILAVQEFAGKSHWNFMSALLRSLTDAGHSVTVFTPFLDGNRDNYEEVDMSVRFTPKLNMSLSELFAAYRSVCPFLWGSVRASRDFCDTLYNDPRLKAVLRGDRGRFDLVLLMPTTTECPAYMAAKLGVPIAYVFAQPMFDHMEQRLTGHTPNSAVVSHLLAGHAVPSTFAQRLANVALATGGALLVLFRELTLMKLSLGSTRPYDLTPPVKPSAVFVNSHYATDASRPFPPNVFHVGGIHLRPVKRLPKDILEFIEDSPNGVIYFTFGSIVSMTSLPDHIQSSIKEALAQLPLRVLWKYEGEMKDKPKNVMTRKWFPQRDILMHPNVKLFISHGGISGIYEAVDGAVPILGFPLFFDQPRNLANLVYNGMAISMDLLSLTTDTFMKNIMELIITKSIQEMQKLLMNVLKIDRCHLSNQWFTGWNILFVTKELLI